MKYNFYVLAILFTFFACKENPSENVGTMTSTPETMQDSVQDFAIVIHGGAGTILKENMTDSLEKAYEAKLTEAIQTGYKILQNGGTSLKRCSVPLT